MTRWKRCTTLDAIQQGSRQRSGGSELDTSTLNRAVAQLHFQTILRQNSGGFVGPFDCNDGWS